jgi:hypothetical protein
MQTSEELFILGEDGERHAHILAHLLQLTACNNQIFQYLKGQCHEIFNFWLFS